MEQVRIGIIGGSGLYNMEEFTDRTSYDIDTSFGKPSAPVVVGTLRGQRIAFIPRHGEGHRYNPTEVPYRANIMALKMMGVTHLITVSACGSLKEDYAPGHMVVPDQLFDFTKDRKRTFFEDGLVGHVSVAAPFSAKLIDLLVESLIDAGGTVHTGCNFITIEGPRFSTYAESMLFRNWNMGIIGMTTSPEAYLAREAEIHYATIGHVTDYDVWHEEEEPVTVEMVIATMQKSIATVQKSLAIAVEKLGNNFDAYTNPAISNALANATMTNPEVIPQETLDRLAPIIGKYFAK